METFILNPRCWQVFRIVGRNPLLRRCDRIEALVALVGVVVMLIAVPLAGLAASVVYTDRGRQYAHEALTRQVVTAAVVTADTTDAGTASAAASQPAAPTDGRTNPIRPNSPFDLGAVVVTARWNSPAGERTGAIQTNNPVEAGQYLRIWVGPGGNPVHPPTPAYRAVIDAAIIAVAILLGVPAVMSCLLAATRWRTDRARDTQWDSEIRSLQSDTGRSNQP